MQPRSGIETGSSRRRIPLGICNLSRSIPCTFEARSFFASSSTSDLCFAHLLLCRHHEVCLLFSSLSAVLSFSLFALSAISSSFLIPIEAASDEVGAPHRVVVKCIPRVQILADTVEGLAQFLSDLNP